MPPSIQARQLQYLVHKPLVRILARMRANGHEKSPVHTGLFCLHRCGVSAAAPVQRQRFVGGRLVADREVVEGGQGFVEVLIGAQREGVEAGA